MIRMLVAIIIIFAGIAHGGEKAAEILTRDANNEADQLREQAYMYQSLAYIEAATSLCHRMINRHPNSPQAGEAKARLIELGNLRAQLLGNFAAQQPDEQPPAPVYPSADEMLRHATEYVRLDSKAGLLAAEILCQEIIRRHPGTPEAMQAAEQLLRIAAVKNSPPAKPAGQAAATGKTAQPAAADAKPQFTFEEDRSEWSLPKPEDLYGEETPQRKR